MVEEAQNQMNKISNLYQSFYNEEHTFDELIEMSISKNRARELVKVLSQCQCCERHQINRPSTMVENYTGYLVNTYGENQKCNCSCRHYCRFLNTAFS